MLLLLSLSCLCLFIYGLMVFIYIFFVSTNQTMPSSIVLCVLFLLMLLLQMMFYFYFNVVLFCTSWANLIKKMSGKVQFELSLCLCLLYKHLKVQNHDFLLLVGNTLVHFVPGLVPIKYIWKQHMHINKFNLDASFWT
jgi:hypothetical protein